MKIETQVTPLEQSKKFLELGLNLKTVWMWCDDKRGDPYVHITVRLNPKKGELYPAPTVAELFFILPWSIDFEGSVYELRIEKTEDYCNVCYWCDLLNQDLENTLLVSINGTLREALADVLIFLIKEKHLKVEDLKL